MKNTDAQPVVPFPHNEALNYDKGIDMLSGMSLGILADGLVNEAEARFFCTQALEICSINHGYPFDDIKRRIRAILADQRIDAEELQELQELMKDICGGIKADGVFCTSTLPLDKPQPRHVDFLNKEVRVTGKFAFGKRSMVFNSLEAMGAIVSDSMPSGKTDILLVGEIVSRDWIATTHGLKILKGVELREKGHPIQIIGEATVREILVEARDSRFSPGFKWAILKERLSDVSRGSFRIGDMFHRERAAYELPWGEACSLGGETIQVLEPRGTGFDVKHLIYEGSSMEHKTTTLTGAELFALLRGTPKQ